MFHLQLFASKVLRLIEFNNEIINFAERINFNKSISNMKTRSVPLKILDKTQCLVNFWLPLVSSNASNNGVDVNAGQ